MIMAGAVAHSWKMPHRPGLYVNPHFFEGPGRPGLSNAVFRAFRYTPEEIAAARRA